MRTVFMEIQPENVMVVLKEIDGFVSAERTQIIIGGMPYRAVGATIDLDNETNTVMCLRDARPQQRASLSPRPGIAGVK